MANHTVWASILAFACILFVLGFLLCIPFMLAKLRGMSPAIDRGMDSLASWMGAAAPLPGSKGSKHPAPKSFLRSLKVTKFARSDDLEAEGATEDCCAICCCEYEPGQPVINLSCSHMFHKECIVAWLKLDAVCPICKAQLLPKPRKASGCHCSRAQHATDQCEATAAEAANGQQTAADTRPAASAAALGLARNLTPPPPAAATAAAGAQVAQPLPFPLPRLPSGRGLPAPMLGVAGVSP